MDLTYCVVNTNGEEHLTACLDAIRDTFPAGLDAEILVLDNASGDGSADVVRDWVTAAGEFGDRVRLIQLDRREGKAANDSRLMSEAKGEFCLLLNEDAELQAGCVDALLEAMRAYPQAGAAGAQLLDSQGREVPCAWRLPTLGTYFSLVLMMHKKRVTQSGAGPTREVGWVQSAAMLVRRKAAVDVNFLDPDFFVYSDETDFCKRLGDAGWITLHVPAARAIHHEQLATDRSGTRRIVEFHRNRDLYMRKHHGRVTAAIARVIATVPYLCRALIAPFLKGHSASWYLQHAKYALFPNSGEGIREAAEAYNAKLDQS